MDITLLGPLAVAVDGKPIALGGRKQQALLAFLALNAPHDVSPDRCIQAVWGEDAPEGAIRSLQTYISNLRREVEPHHLRGEPWSVIETTSAGDYRLAIPDDATDAYRFESHVANALKARPEDAMGTFDTGLKLWGERPLGELGDEPWAQPFVSRVTATYLEALSGQINTRLELGEHEAVIGDLEALVEEHPFDERLWGYLMLALYRSSRQAEAMRTYGRLRTTLKEELGIDPSPELQGLEEQILRQDPALAPPVRIPNNLPASISSFIGRAEELAQVRSLLAANRLVTITGAPGAGKTRLAYEVAATVIHDHPDGVWSVELAPLQDGELIVTEMLGVAGLDAPVSKTPLEALCDQVAGWKALLVVDNCEHLLGAVARTINTVLRAAPDLRVLATSRHSLDVGGEVAWRLPPLTVPELGDEQALSTDSARLFIERARSAQPSLDVAPDAERIAEICRRLDGLPLAIELAASRVRSLTIRELCDRLDDRFRLLTHGDPADLDHHRTLGAMVDWSYDLLDVREQELYRRLAVFRGGWTPEAAEAVGVSKRISADDLFELADGLMANSLISRDVVEGPSRFRMLETMREHGEALLRDTSEITDVRNAHLEWVRSLTEEAATELDGADQKEWIQALNADLDNMRAAYQWGLSDGDAAIALDAASRIPRYWWLTSEIAEGADWLERLIAAAPDAPTDVRARGLSASGFLINMLGRSREAEARLRESVNMFREVGDDIGLAWALNFLGRAAWETDDPSTLRSYQREAMGLFADNGVGQGVFLSRIMEFAVVAFHERDKAMSREMAPQIVAMAEQVGAPNALAHAYESEAWVNWEPEEVEASFISYRKALSYYRGLGNRDCAAHCLAGVAHGLTLLERNADAAELMGAVDTLLESLSVIPPGYEREMYVWTQQALGDSEPESRQLGRGLTLEAAIDRAYELMGGR